MQENCGLDTRCYRMQGYSRWYNLDLPEVMALREKLLPEAGVITQIAASAMDANWAQGVAADGKPVLVILEGLTMYLTEPDVKQIFAIIAALFPDVSVFVETMTPFIVKEVKEKSIEGSHAKFTWGVKNGKSLAALLPDFTFVEEHSLVEGMEVIAPVYRVIGRFDLHMTGLIIVVADIKPFELSDYKRFDDKTLLVLPKADKAFSEAAQADLLLSMPKAKSVKVEGGHTATLYKVDEYVRETRAFLETDL